MRIEEFLGSLPKSIMTGDDVELQDQTLREIFEFAQVGRDDVLYHLGCGSGRGLAIALEEFSAGRAVGIEIDPAKASAARDWLGQRNARGWEVRTEDIRDSDLRDATVVLFWFSDPETVDRMKEKLSGLAEGCRIVTIWGPLPGNMPDGVEFPYILNRVPFRSAESLRDQTMAIFGTDCIDFVTAWEFAERYTRAVAPGNPENDRFLTVIQTLTIWINAKNLGIACGDEVPLPVKNYIGILKTYFGIEMGHMLDQKPRG